MGDLPDTSTPNRAVWEPAVAVGATRVVSAFIVGGANRRVGFSIQDLSTGSVTEGIIHGASGEGDAACDPSIVYDPTDDQFVVVARDGGAKLRVAHLDPNDSQFSEWNDFVDESSPPQSPRNDKPWLLAGEATEFGREYYVTYYYEVGEEYRYRRSTDGGSTWVGGTIYVDSDALTGAAIAMQPTVYAGRALFAVYVKEQDGLSGAELRFIRGVDDSDDPNNATVTFDDLRLPPPPTFGPIPPDEDGGPLAVFLNRGVVNLGSSDLLRQAPGTFDIQTVPWLLADPTSADRLFLVYHDTETSDPNDADFNIYCQVLSKHSATQWTVGSRVLVSDADTIAESDQFTPAPFVDASGILHIVYYDDRNYTDPVEPPFVDLQPDGSSTPYPKFDVWYTFSDDHGATFAESQLCFGSPPVTETDEPNLDLEELDSWPFPKIGEYIDMDGYNGEIWSVYTGSSAVRAAADPNSNPNVIWGTAIVSP